MKYLIFIISLIIILAFGISDAWAQSMPTVFIDTVVKIKEDDEGKLVILKKAAPILYLKYSASNYESIFSVLDNSLAFGSSVKITTDGKLNVIKAD